MLSKQDYCSGSGRECGQGEGVVDGGGWQAKC